MGCSDRPHHALLGVARHALSWAPDTCALTKPLLYTHALHPRTHGCSLALRPSLPPCINRPSLPLPATPWFPVPPCHPRIHSAPVRRHCARVRRSVLCPSAAGALPPQCMHTLSSSTRTCQHCPCMCREPLPCTNAHGLFDWVATDLLQLCCTACRHRGRHASTAQQRWRWLAHTHASPPSLLSNR